MTPREVGIRDQQQPSHPISRYPRPHPSSRYLNQTLHHVNPDASGVAKFEAFIPLAQVNKAQVAINRGVFDGFDSRKPCNLSASRRYKAQTLLSVTAKA